MYHLYLLWRHCRQWLTYQRTCSDNCRILISFSFRMVTGIQAWAQQLTTATCMSPSHRSTRNSHEIGFLTSHKPLISHVIDLLANHDPRNKLGSGQMTGSQTNPEGWTWDLTNRVLRFRQVICCPTNHDPPINHVICCLTNHELISCQTSRLSQIWEGVMSWIVGLVALQGSRIVCVWGRK